MVSSSSITGSKKNLEDSSFKYFDKWPWNLNNPIADLAGNRETIKKS